MTNVKLSNGDALTLKPFLTRKAYKEIQKKFWGENANIQGGKIENATMNMINIVDAEDYTIFVMVEDILKADGVSVKPTVTYIEELSTVDYAILKEKVEELTGTKTDEEKKA